MKSSLITLPDFGRSARLGSIVLLCLVFALGCGGSDSAAPESGTPSGAEPGEHAAAAGEHSAASGDRAAQAAEHAAARGPSQQQPAEESPATEEPPAEPAEAPAEEAPAAEEMPVAEEQAAAEQPAAEQPAAEQPAEPLAAAPVNPRPDDIVAWQEEDFRSAKQDRDPRLLDAVAYLGENFSGDSKAAELLVELLTIPEDPEPEPKPEPKVEKKPEKKPSSEYDQYMDGRGAPPDYEGEMYEDGMGDYEDEMESRREEYMGGPGGGDYEEEYGGEYGGGSRRQAELKSPLAASYVSLTGGIVRALGANGTQEARAVLEQLLAGKLSAGNERAAVGAVLRTLVDYPSVKNDELLRQALTAPEAYRPTTEALTATLQQTFAAAAPAAQEGETQEGEAEGGGAKQGEQDVDILVAAALANKVTAEDIRDTTLPLVEKSASMRLRYDLAAYLIGKPSEKIGPRLQELVTATHPLNLEAQIGLYRYPKTPPEMRDSFERYFTTYASCALGRMLAVSTDEGADLEAPLAAGEGATLGAQQGWSGFGDKPTREEPQNRGGRGYAEGYDSEPDMPEYDDRSEEYERRSAEEYERRSSEEYGPGYGEGYEEGYGGRPGSPAGGPPKGPGEADKLSVQKFDEVAAGNPNLPYEMARQLWGNQLGATLATKMKAFASLEEGAQVLMLAAAIPTDAMRGQLLNTLQAHWIDGPEAFASASAYAETGISDPGFIMVIKSLPRREPPAQNRTEPTEEQSAQYAWMQAAYGTVRGFCERFQLAADNEMVNATEVLANLPFKIHSQDTATHVYAVDWQKRVAGRIAGVSVDPMRVYYLRFEETAVFTKILGAYTRSVPSATERAVQNGVWIEGMRTAPESGLRTSMDVIIERPEFSKDRGRSEPERMIIQVLYVEINDPNPPKTATAAK